MSIDWSGSRTWETPTGKPFSTRLPPRSDAQDMEAWQLFEDYLAGRGLNAGLARANGWYLSRDAGDDLPRIVIPCYSMMNKENIYWQARDITGNAKVRYQSPSRCARGDAIVVVNPIRSLITGVAVCEGAIDPLAAADEGWIGVGLMGASPPSEVIESLIKQLSTVLWAKMPKLFVADRDSVAAFTRLATRFPGALVINPYPWKDLAEVPKSDRAEVLGG